MNTQQMYEKALYRARALAADLHIPNVDRLNLPDLLDRIRETIRTKRTDSAT